MLLQTVTFGWPFVIAALARARHAAAVLFIEAADRTPWKLPRVNLAVCGDHAVSDTPTGHPTPERLAAFSRGALADKECSILEDHVADCETCRMTLETLPDDPLVGLMRVAVASTSTSPARRRLQLGFEIFEEIGRGGMAVVYKARQAGLNRFVALKMIHAATPPETLARFRREAETVARLNHPNIVKIHEVGDLDGQPYLALEYVEGGSLASKLTGPLAPRAGAALIETLALAVEHAHERGIVHRDLKPSNVLLSFDGGSENGAVHASTPSKWVPKISDFGLAKDCTRELAQTQTGAIMGTPSYMAPEQATGRMHQVGPAADVYALGAMLYEVLTGRPPFQGATLLEALEQTRSREPVPPSRLQSAVPRDLETICLKCLQKDAHKRYASAASLAEDLRSFLAGEAIRARPVPRWERAYKWARRRPAVAGLLALAAVTLITLVGGLWLHTTRLRAAVQRAETGEARADLNYQQAREAINQMLGRLDKFHATGVPQVEALRLGLRKDALAFYEGIARAEEDAGPARRLDLARAHLLMARVQEPSASYTVLQQARRLLEELIAEEPDNGDYRSELGHCFTGLGQAAAMCGRAEESEPFHVKALQVYEELCRVHPDNTSWQRARAVCHTNLGVCCHVDKRLSEAESHWQEAVHIAEELARQNPQEDANNFQLAVDCANLALLYADTKRFEQSFPLFGKAEACLTSLAQAHPEETQYRFTLVQTLRLWGANLDYVGRGADACPLLTRAIDILDVIVRENPTSEPHLDLLRGCLTARTHSYTLLHRPAEGEADWQRCVQLSAPSNTWGDLCICARWDARSGAHALATTRADWLMKQIGLTADNRYELARAYAAASTAAATDSQLPTPHRQQLAEHHATTALTLLARIAKTGYFKSPENRTALSKGDPEFEPLRSRSDFQKLLAEQPGD
jgi:eukaryotic-like serine/threonine-protein kinase